MPVMKPFLRYCFGIWNDIIPIGREWRVTYAAAGQCAVTSIGEREVLCEGGTVKNKGQINHHHE